MIVIISPAPKGEREGKEKWQLSFPVYPYWTSELVVFPNDNNNNAAKVTFFEDSSGKIISEGGTEVIAFNMT